MLAADTVNAGGTFARDFDVGQKTDRRRTHLAFAVGIAFTRSRHGSLRGVVLFLDSSDRVNKPNRGFAAETIL
jgi:hypothetical protein